MGEDAFPSGAGDLGERDLNVLVGPLA